MKSQFAKHLSAAALAAALFHPFAAPAQTNYSWNAAGNGTWGTTSNWTPVGTPGGNAGDTATIASGTNGTVVTFNSAAGTTTIAGLSLGSPYILTFDSANSKTLAVSSTLDIDGAVVLRGSSSNQTQSLTYTGNSLSASSGRLIIDNDNSGSSGRDFNLNIAAANTNNATIIAASRNTNAGQNSQSYVNLTGSGTFANANSVSIFSDRAGTNNDVALAGTNATFVQTGTSSTLRVGGTDNTLSKTADVEVAALQIRDGSLAGNGEIRSAGGLLIGNGDSAGATLAVNPLAISGMGTTASVTTGNGIASLNIGYQAGTASTVTNLTLASDATVQLQLAPSSLTADLINLNGSLSIDSSATLSLTLFGADAALTAGSKLLLIDYTGTWNSTGFSGLADGTVFTLGVNQYRIDYDGNFSTGALTGGTDVMLTVVPEPQTALCAAIGLTVLLFRRKIKRSGI